MTKSRIVVVDDHPVMRQGIKSIIADELDLEIIGEASTGLEALRVCQNLQPDLVLMDVVMPEMDGIQVIHLLLPQFPKMKFLVMSSFSYGELQHESLRAGATSYIAKNTSAEELIKHIRLVLSADSRKIKYTEHTFDPTTPHLTPSEYKVLVLLFEGLDRAHIATQMGISYDTVKTHLRHLYKKLNVSSSLEAVRVAVKTGLLS